MSTWWSLARRTDIDLGNLGYVPFNITNRAWYVLYRFLASLQVQGLPQLTGDDVLIPTNLAHHWGNAILNANPDAWFQVGEFDGSEIIPVSIVHESVATQYINTHELVPLQGSEIGEWLNHIGQRLAAAPSGIIITSKPPRSLMDDVVDLEKRGSRANITDLAKQTDGAGNLVPPVLDLELSWNARKTQGDDWDLDASAVALNDNEVNTDPQWFVFYNNQSSPNGAIRHMKGDSLDGGGDGPDEVIRFNFADIPAQFTRIDVVVSINKAKERKQSFAEVSNAYARVVDPATGKELVRAKLTDEADEDSTAARFVQFYRTDSGAWFIKKFGDYYTGGLKELTDAYEIKTKNG